MRYIDFLLLHLFTRPSQWKWEKKQWRKHWKLKDQDKKFNQEQKRIKKELNG